MKLSRRSLHWIRLPPSQNLAYRWRDLAVGGRLIPDGSLDCPVELLLTGRGHTSLFFPDRGGQASCEVTDPVLHLENLIRRHYRYQSPIFFRRDLSCDR